MMDILFHQQQTLRRQSHGHNLSGSNQSLGITGLSSLDVDSRGSSPGKRVFHLPLPLQGLNGLNGMFIRRFLQT